MAKAKAKISAAQDTLQKAQEDYLQAVAAGQGIDSDLAIAQANLQAAQAAYDRSLILDSSWIRPNKEIQVSEQVPYTVQVSNTELVTTTELVPRTVTTIIPGGLVAKSYNMLGYNNSPPLPTEDRLVSTQIVSNINFQWGGGQILNSGLYEDVIVSFTGTINIPQTGTYTFYSPADDGTKLYIDNNLIINDWVDKGGGGTMVQTNLAEGQHSLTLWYYENGGGANVWLYWITPGGPFVLVPASAFGETTQTTTVYDEVTTVTEVTTITEEIEYRTETHTEVVPDDTAIQPMIKDASLLPSILAAQSALNSITTRKTENQTIIDSLSSAVSVAQQNLVLANNELNDIPPFIPEPIPVIEPTPEPEITPEPVAPEEEINNLVSIDPQDLSEKQVEQLVEAANAVFETATQGSPEYNQALEALAIAAEADDPELPAELAAIPGAAVVFEAFNNLGNVGADMAPQVREEAEKTVIASVIAAGAAVNAVATATTATSSGGGTSSRRNK